MISKNVLHFKGFFIFNFLAQGLDQSKWYQLMMLHLKKPSKKKTKLERIVSR